MRRVMLLAAVLVAAAACGGGDKNAGGTGASASGAVSQSGGNGASGPKGDAVVSGVINFNGTAPANPAIDMSQEAACKGKYTAAPHDPEYVVNAGKLGNVFVYVKSGLPAGAKYDPPGTDVEIDQSGCLYHPRVFGIMVGQKLLIKNGDPVLHNIKAVPAKNRGFNISQPSEGMKTERTFSTEEVMVPLQCNVHSWMHAYVGVLSHPFFATSDSTGAFKITGLPPGTYTIEAWHEKLGTQQMSVTVGAGETKTADFTFGTKA
jgi:carboxypeptidase family protein